MMTIDRNWSTPQPVSDAIGSRALRRRKVVALFAGYALTGLTALIISTRPAFPIRIAAAVLFVLAVIACAWGFFSLLGRTAVNAPNIEAGALDERQLTRRHEAFSRTQPYLGFAIAGSAAYAMFSWLVPQTHSAGFLTYVLYGVLLLGMTLPTTYLAWTEPDPEPRDDA